MTVIPTDRSAMNLIRTAVLLSLLGACDIPRESARADSAPPSTLIRGEVLSHSDSMSRPASIDVVGSHLVVTDGFARSQVRVFRSRDGALVASFGRKGSGPGEFQGPAHVDPVPGSSSAFWVHDPSLRRTTFFDLARDTLEPLSAGDRSISYDPGPMPLYVRWIGPDKLVGAGIVTPGRLGIFDQSGKLIETVGTIPGKDGRTPDVVLQHAYSGPLVANPSRTRLALANRHADRLEIFDASGVEQRTVRVRGGFLPKFVVRSNSQGPSMASGEDTRFAYIDAAATESAIYGLFSGTRRMDRPGRAAFGDIVYVFDWEGRLTRVLKLDALAVAIAVDPDGRTLYAILWDPRPAIARYALPDAHERSASAR